MWAEWYDVCNSMYVYTTIPPYGKNMWRSRHTHVYIYVYMVYWLDGLEGWLANCLIVDTPPQINRYTNKAQTTEEPRVEAPYMLKPKAWDTLQKQYKRTCKAWDKLCKRNLNAQNNLEIVMKWKPRAQDSMPNAPQGTSSQTARQQTKTPNAPEAEYIQTKQLVSELLDPTFWHVAQMVLKWMTTYLAV